MDFMNKPKENTVALGSLYCTATGYFWRRQDNLSFILCVTRGQESSLSTWAEGLELCDSVWGQNIFKWMFLMERWVEYWFKSWTFLLSWESQSFFVKLTWRLKLCKHVTKVLFIPQDAVHEDHTREAETLRFLALIDACSWAEALKELQGQIWITWQLVISSHWETLCPRHISNLAICPQSHI